MANVCHALEHTRSSKRVSEARASSCPSCADVSEMMAEAFPRKAVRTYRDGS